MYRIVYHMSHKLMWFMIDKFVLKVCQKLDDTVIFATRIRVWCRGLQFRVSSSFRRLDFYKKWVSS